MKSILVVSCTRGKKAETRLYASLRGFHQSEIKTSWHENNVTPLPVIYNRYLNSKTLKKHDIVLFVHDDLYIDDYKLRGKLYNAMKRYDIVGLAGATKLSIKPPSLWHLMSNKENQRGFVHHPVESSSDEWTTSCASFGPTPANVAIIDGLFIAVSIKKALEVSWNFNEEFTFHHYDIASCIDALEKKLTIGVTPIHTIHSSPGLADYNDISFQDSQTKFLELYRNG